MKAPERRVDANRLLTGLVDIIAGGSAMSSQFERLGRELGVGKGPQAIVFLTGIKKILRQLPEKAFTDKNARFAMVDAVQDALDAAIEEEEQMLESDAKGDS